MDDTFLMEHPKQKPYVVAITGASGSIYGLRFVEAITELGHLITLTISESARTVMKEELGIEIESLSSSEFLAKLFNFDDRQAAVFELTQKRLALRVNL